MFNIGDTIRNLYPIRFNSPLYEDNERCIKDILIIDYSKDSNNFISKDWYYEKVFLTVNNKKYVYPKYPNYTSNGVLTYKIPDIKNTVKLNKFLAEGFPFFYGTDQSTAYTTWLEQLIAIWPDSTKLVVTENKTWTYPKYNIITDETGESGWTSTLIDIPVTKTVYDTGTINCPCIELAPGQLTGTIINTSYNTPDGQNIVLGNWHTSLLPNKNYIFPSDTNITVNIENKPQLLKYKSKFNIWDYMGSNGNVILNTPDSNNIYDFQNVYSSYEIPVWEII